MSDDPIGPENPEGENETDDRGVGREGIVNRTTGVGTRVGRALLIPTLAFFTALVLGAVIIALTNIDILRLWGNDPGEALRQTVSDVTDAYQALFQGSIGSPRALSETLFSATPLILTGLAVALGFQAGLFNIGANGQLHMGGMAALYIAFSLDLPAVPLISLALLAAMVAGGVWGAIPGYLKATTGAHEVITTIMFNFIALFLVNYLLTTRVFQATGRDDPISKPVNEAAELPRLFGSDYRIHIGFFVALVAVAFTQWLLYRSVMGFEFRAVGANPEAARYAGMKVTLVFVLVMAIAGALAGLAGANQILGLEPFRAQSNFAGTTGFDGISIALLGRSNPVGVLWAGILFGALRAGGREMQGVAGVPIDLVIVIQALIIVFIAAPAVIRAIYRLPEPSEGDEETPVVSGGWGA
mgnify:CR=1 FL=1